MCTSENVGLVDAFVVRCIEYGICQFRWRFPAGTAWIRWATRRLEMPSLHGVVYGFVGTGAKEEQVVGHRNGDTGDYHLTLTLAVPTLPFLRFPSSLVCRFSQRHGTCQQKECPSAQACIDYGRSAFSVLESWSLEALNAS